MTGDHVVESLGFHRIGGVPFGPLAMVLAGTTEAHGVMLVGAREFPWRTILQPGFRLFNLLSIEDRLCEHAVLVADAITPGGKPKRRHRIEEAGRQPAQTAIAERRIGFTFHHLVD